MEDTKKWEPDEVIPEIDIENVPLVD